MPLRPHDGHTAPFGQNIDSKGATAPSAVVSWAAKKATSRTQTMAASLCCIDGRGAGRVPGTKRSRPHVSTCWEQTEALACRRQRTRNSARREPVGRCSTRKCHGLGCQATHLELGGRYSSEVTSCCETAVAHCGVARREAILTPSRAGQGENGVGEYLDAALHDTGEGMTHRQRERKRSQKSSYWLLGSTSLSHG